MILQDGLVLAAAKVPSGFDQQKAAAESFTQALRKAALQKTAVSYIVATGAGKTEVPFADSVLTDVSAAAKGAKCSCPTARTVVDVGAENVRVAKIDQYGRVLDFAVNDQCAALTGSFVEVMSRALEVTVEEMGVLALQSTKIVPMNAQCAVFAESEVVSLIHANTTIADIARAVLDAMAGRVISLVRRIGAEADLVLTGGMANSPGFVKSMAEGLAMQVVLPEAADFIGALGAAAIAAAKAAR
ncbi:MAG: acyl-CoA dehydratase activase [Firmicutes bacterium]|nr:acyl-CoA dehydratase activase [Bacillota bacterium]